MRTTILLLLTFLLNPVFFYGQIITPVIKARFGVDADLRANYFNGSIVSGNDDWFNNGTAGTGETVIDTTGASGIIAGYLSDVSPFPKRMSSLYRGMSKPPFSIISNRLWLDALFVRDYHGTDTTVYTSGSDKNGMSPGVWTGGIQGVPDKNDILDIFVHVRRAGPNTTDSLWMFGGISLDNTTGNRYFDFEMYQTDIYYDRASSKFYGYGADEGHTSWQFDSGGNITRPGDIIFSGEFQSGVLTNIEARIWVKQTDWQTIVPTAFNWSGLFDGAGLGATYGYASISPNTLGAFYTGLGSPNNTWAGPFGLVLQDNSLAFTSPAPASTTNSKYIANQFIEFSVNLTKLGLDPVTLLGGDVCGTPFNRIIVKTRASAAFTAELKDFVAPTDLFLAPRVFALTETPNLCDDGGIAEVHVSNPVATSVYQWSTTDGNIISSPTGPSIYVDQPGTYIVTQYLQAGCNAYATDTVMVTAITNCEILDKNFAEFYGSLNDNTVLLDWKVLNNQQIKDFEVQRSEDGLNFASIGVVKTQGTGSSDAGFSYLDDVSNVNINLLHYRIKLFNMNGTVQYSYSIRIRLPQGKGKEIVISPNPVKGIMNLHIWAGASGNIRLDIFDQSGRQVSSSTFSTKGKSIIAVDDLANKPRGVYMVVIYAGNTVTRQKVILAN